MDRLLAVFKYANGTLGLAACVNATGQCLTTAAPTISWSYFEFDPDYGSVRVMDSEMLVQLPLVCCVCKNFDVYTYGLDSDGQLSLAPVTPLLTSGGGCYDVAAGEVWISEGITGVDCDSTIDVMEYSYSTGQTVANVTLRASDIFAVFGGECSARGGGGSAGDNSMPGWAIGLIIASGATVGLGALWCAVKHGTAHATKSAHGSQSPI